VDGSLAEAVIAVNLEAGAARSRLRREVFALVAAGLLNKLVADRLGIAEKTVKIIGAA
jgi:DNA-binding NarL/FixJ family response regulator